MKIFQSTITQKENLPHFDLCYSLFLILLKSFRSSGLQLYWRDTPALVFQNQPFVDLLQNRCSWVIYKTHRETVTILNTSYFFKYTLFYRTSPVAAPESFRFPSCNFIKKGTTTKMFFCKFCKISKDIFFFWQNTFGWLLLVFICEFWIFQDTFFIEHLRKTTISCTTWRISTTRYSKKLFHRSF